jgi:dihydrofolate synthase/folylpolyglutamate synthase
VAGTKGKGSTSAMLASALSASGVRTGFLSSPHLHKLEERFCVDGRAASASDLVCLTNAVRPTIEALDAKGLAASQRGPTFFEVTAAMGLLHFARVGTGAVVLEVGMGGRLDSTNVVRPAVSVITNISFDHTKQLGNTLAAIAREKAGIIKRGRPVVSGDFGRDAREVIRGVARARRSRLFEIGEDFRFEYEAPRQPLARPAAGRVSVRTWLTDWGSIELPMLGKHQAHNAAVALATLDELAGQDLVVGREAVARGFASLRWPARVEVMGEAPWIVVDGAHNVASAEALAETLRTCFPPTPRTLIFGTTREKDLLGQLRALLPGTVTVVATRYVENPRSVPPEEVAAAVRSLGGVGVIVTRDPAQALDAARRATPRDGLICVAGSLFLAAETRALLLQRPGPLSR